MLGGDDGAAVMSAPVLRRLVALAAEPVAPAGAPPQVSGREWEVARLVAQGLSNAEISATPHLSLATVKTHVGSLFAKLGLDNRVQLAILVLELESGRAGSVGEAGEADERARPATTPTRRSGRRTGRRARCRRRTPPCRAR
ncbi:hypothetical protein GCM10023066_55700 [Nocardioides kongjuensis]